MSSKTIPMNTMVRALAMLQKDKLPSEIQTDCGPSTVDRSEPRSIRCIFLALNAWDMHEACPAEKSRTIS